MTQQERELDRAKRRAWRLANPEKVKAYKRAYYLKHKDRLLGQFKQKYLLSLREGAISRAKARYEAKKAEILAKKREAYREDPAKYLAASKAYRSQLGEAEMSNRYRDYRQSYIDKDLSRYKVVESNKRHKRRALLVGAFVETVDPAVVWARDKGRCGICNRRVNGKSGWHLDHVIPISKGGAHSYDNVQVAHPRCNSSKRDSVPLGQIGLFQVGGGRK